MNHSVKKGCSFGLTSGIITTVGLIVGLNASTGSKNVILGGILVIAVADALSDALGIHVSEESEGHHTAKEIWQSTISTFLAKFIIALTFIIPILTMPLYAAMIMSMFWGLALIAGLSYYVASMYNRDPWDAVFEHLVITIVVLVVTQLLGFWVATL